MPLRPQVKKDPRPVPIMVRLSKLAAEQLKALAKANNMSHADVFEVLLQDEMDRQRASNGAVAKGAKWMAAEPETSDK